MTRRQWGGLLLVACVPGCRPRTTHHADDSGAPSADRIEVDVSRVAGPFDRLSGVQGSPWPIVAGDVDRTTGFRDYRIEHVRIEQDCHPNTLTLGGIFPDEDADPDRPESYRFGEVDQHLRAARLAGAAVLWQASYDVGGSDRWVGRNLGGRAPRDLTRWGRVVQRCLQHFNNGWAAGLAHSVDCVEFPNEPDGLGGFQGAADPALGAAFLHFLDVVSAYNGQFPGTQVRAVGPGIPLGLREWPRYEPSFAALLDRIRSTQRTLPVFSFHSYGADVSPAANARLARALRDLLDGHGMRDTELWNTEWQAGDFIDLHLRVDAKRKRLATPQERRHYAGACATYALACKTRWQGVVKGSYYYRATARPFPDGSRTPGAAFFSESGQAGAMALQERVTDSIAQSTPVRCSTDWQDDGLLAAVGLRSADGRRVGLLATNLAPRARHLTVRFSSVSWEGARAGRAVAMSAERDALLEQAIPSQSVAGGKGKVEIAVSVGALAWVFLLLDAPA